MRIGDSQLEDIRQRVDVVELVREFVPALKQAGRNFKACCPFHQEKTPSFMVNPERQIYHCFGCQAGGDVFAFVMQMEGLSFPEAARKLAERAGVKLEEERSASPEERDRAKLKAALVFAREYYREQLLKSPEAEPARAYLQKRGVNAEASEKFGLGYAPRSGGLIAAAAKKGFDAALLSRTGLAAQRQGQGTYRDYFWGRILYPIQNIKGEMVGFGARAMGDAEPKYLNSPDGPLFSKGRVLYGLVEGLAALRKARRAVILEGYMDVIALHQFGLTNACAPLGTALTEDHVQLIKRYADTAVLVFDPDAAGAAASLRGAELLLAAGLMVRIATLPGELDPDELLHKSGVAGWDAALEKALDLPAYRTELALQGRKGPLAAEEKSRIAAAVLETVRKSSDEVLKREWLRRLAQRLELDEESLHLELNRSSDAPPTRRIRPAAPAVRDAKPVPAGEEMILLALLRQPGLAADPALVAENDFSHPGARAIFSGIRAAAGPGDWTGRLLASLPGPDAAAARAMLCDPRSMDDPARSVAEQVSRLRKGRRLEELRPKVVAMTGGGLPADPELQAEYGRLLSELKGARKGD